MKAPLAQVMALDNYLMLARHIWVGLSTTQRWQQPHGVLKRSAVVVVLVVAVVVVAVAAVVLVVMVDKILGAADKDTRITTKQGIILLRSGGICHQNSAKRLRDCVLLTGTSVQQHQKFHLIMTLKRIP